MPHSTPIGNPFMLLLNPEIVLAAVERSERLGQLNRHLCRPLDRPVLPGSRAAADLAEADAAEEAVPEDVAEDAAE